MENSNNNNYIEINKETKCYNHLKSFEYLCNKCNILLCHKCYDEHIQEHSDHSCCYHIYDIRDSLSKINLYQDSCIVNSNKKQNNKNNNKNSLESKLKINHYKEEVEVIWDFIKSSSIQMRSLEVKESEVSNYYKDLHEYLIVEEHRLKKPIIDDINRIKEQINHEIDKLKSLINIITLNNQDIDTSDTISNTTDIESSDSLSTTTSLIESNEPYSISSIIQCIQESESIQQFVSNSNIYNLSTFHTENQKSIDLFNNNTDLIILDLLTKYNNKFKSNNSSNKNHNIKSTYSIYKNNDLIQKIKRNISSAIQLNQCLLPTLLSTHSNGSRATLFDISDYNCIRVIEDFEFEYERAGTCSSYSKIGDDIFIFGGIKADSSVDRQYCRYSIKSKSITHRGTMNFNSNGNGNSNDTRGAAFNISVCYDGRENIYLIGGYDNVLHANANKRSIDRFNINTFKFERYHNFEFTHMVILSFFFNNLLYSLPYNESSIHIFNTSNKTTEVYTNNGLFKNARSACTDGNGNIYIHSKDKRFIRFNITSREIHNLSPLEIEFDCCLSMIYSHYSSIDSFIYLMGGSEFGNHFYSCRKNLWMPFKEVNTLLDDSYDRRWCFSLSLD